MPKSGFSFLELMVVVVIVGIMAFFAMSGYGKYTERNRGKSAIANLNAIYNAEKRYRLDNKIFYPCSGASWACTSTDFDQDHLGIAVFDPYFSYAISATAGTTFTATATRKGAGGLCSGKTITFTNDISDLGTNCSFWVSAYVHEN